MAQTSEDLVASPIVIAAMADADDNWRERRGQGFNGPASHQPLHWSFPELQHQEIQQESDQPSDVLPMLSSPVQEGWWWDNSGCRVWIPAFSTHISQAEQLQQFLQYYDVVAIDEILKSRQVRTVADLQMMRTTMKLEVHCAAQMMYRLLGAHYLSDGRRNNLEALFHVPHTPTEPLQRKATVLKKSLHSHEFTVAGNKWFGEDRMSEFQRLMNQSDAMARLSVIHAGQACAIINVPKHLQPSKKQIAHRYWVDSEELLDFRKLRTALNKSAAWRVAGYVLGVDNKDAAEKILQDAFDQDELYIPDGKSSYCQIMGTFVRIQEEVTRSSLSEESQNTDNGPSQRELAPGVCKQLAEIKALIDKVNKQNERMQAEVERLISTEDQSSSQEPNE